MPKHLEHLIRSIKILIVDDDYHMRKVVRTMLSAIGVREIYDACDGMAGLQSICATLPDIVILDWEMPQVGGAEFVRSVRKPGSFPVPNVPIIVLTGHGERSCVVEAMKLGANEYLLKPVSTKGLFDRLVSVLEKPRPMVRRGDFYGPLPRKSAIGVNQADVEAINPEVVHQAGYQAGQQAVHQASHQVAQQAAGDDKQDRDKRENVDDVVLI